MSETPKAEQVVVDITISAPIEEVWKALRDPEAIANWFGWDAAGLAEEIDYIFVAHAAADDAARVLRFAEWENISHRLDLTPSGGGTRLRLVCSGAPELDWDGIYEDIREGWVTFLEQLRFGLDRHREQKRRTFYLSGAARAGVGDLRSVLGLETALAGEPGETSGASTPLGELTGDIWHKTHFQFGLTVPAWGDGLLVVTDKGVAPGTGQRSGSVIATTFGLSEADFARLEARWSEWWQAHYAAPQSPDANP